ncbi:hypothetical protein [Paenibacillus fonticola]|uniref:hypothetical protein n=1 Tax=Paenibacillus fonticola TaxID=379896 RepID=UPI000360B895|nr:hypothetical protein [Paenibacillus fonticola]
MRQRGRAYSLCFMGVVWMVLLVITGCASSTPSWTNFEGSAVEKSFPVPKEASITETALNNSRMDYVHYSLTGIEQSSSVPEKYQQVIHEWGWTEQEDQNSGTTRVYQKDKLVVQLTIHDDSFTVLVPKQDKKTVIQGLESSP